MKYTNHINPENISKSGYRTSYFSNYPFKIVDDRQSFYQFGVFSGWSIIELAKIFISRFIPIQNIYGFDSFEGIPACDKEPLWNGCWGEGEFSTKSFFSVDTVDDAVRNMYLHLKEHIPIENVLLMPGFFKDSLTQHLGENLNPALFVDIDVDIYSSAREALFFLAKHKLLRVGTVINYDDWGGSPGHQTFSNGESRAHREMCETFGIECKEVIFNGGQKTFEVTKI